MFGNIKTFNSAKGHGFIVDDNGDSRFFYGSEVKGEPQPGNIVSFDPGNNKRGLCARCINIISNIQHNNNAAILEEVSNWKMEAKLEDNERYFYHTSEVDNIENGNKCYVIGRKGTGKTAISEHLYKKMLPKRFSKKLTFKNFPFNDLYSMDNNSYTPPNQYITLWKYLIYSSIAQMMIKNENVDSETREILSKVYEDNPRKSLASMISSWTNQEYEIKILGTGGKIGITRDTSPNRTSWIDKVEILERVISDFIDDSAYFIVFDELDEDYKVDSIASKENQYKALLTSLFKAVQDVKSTFCNDRYKILPVIFLRDDIYNLIDDPDKTKWSDFSINLDWNQQKIKSLLAFRLSRAIGRDNAILPFTVAWNTIFDVNSIYSGDGRKRPIGIFEFITRSTHVRPRDYIKYLGECARETLARKRNLISADIVRKVDKAFSNYLKSELEDEIHGVLPEIREIFHIISHIRKQYFRSDVFVSVYNEQIQSGAITNKGAENILRTLFHFSVIGNQPSQKNIQVFRYLNKDARLNLIEVICVHRGLYKALQIL